MPPVYAWFLALRYLAARRVNLVGMLGVAVAVWALIVVISVFSGFLGEITDNVRASSAELLLTGVRERSSYEAVREVLERDPDVASTAPRLRHYAILYPYQPPRALGGPAMSTRALEANPLAFNFVELLAIDPEREARTSAFATWLANPGTGARSALASLYRVDDPAAPFAVPRERQEEAMRLLGQRVPPGGLLEASPGILMSWRRLRFSEQVEPGQQVELVSARFAEQARAEDLKKIRGRFAVAGAYETRHRLFDDSHALIGLEALRTLLGHDAADPEGTDLVSEVAIRARPGADLDTLARRLAAAVAGVSGGTVQTWRQQNAVFLGAVEQERGLMKIVLFAVMLVAAFLIYATLHMMVTGKFRDIGILMALGASPQGIQALFLLCGLTVSGLGCLLGFLAGRWSAVHLNDVNDAVHARFGIELFPRELYSLERIPYRLEAEWIVQVLVAALVLSLLVSYLPARRAARMPPVRAIAYE